MTTHAKVSTDKVFDPRLRGHGVVYRNIARLAFYDDAAYPALYSLQGVAFEAFNEWFGHDTLFADQSPEDVTLALLLMGAIVDEEFE